MFWKKPTLRLPLQIVTRSVSSKPQNQDRLAVFEINAASVFALADGAGGRAGGAEAAQLFIDCVGKQAAAVPNPQQPRQWSALISAADKSLEADSRTGETTGIIVATNGHFISGASVGDSSVWLLDERHIFHLTQNQQRKPFLGWGGAVPTPFSAKWEAGILLIASDGLTKYTAPETIASIVLQNDLEVAANQLIEQARAPSGALPDDVSFVLVRN